MQSGRIIALHLKPQKGELVRVESLSAVEGKGFVGDVHYGRESRQVLIVSSEELDELGYEPGTLREQVTVDLARLRTLAPGTKLKTSGGAVFVIEEKCAPCAHMAKRLDEDPEEFKAKTNGRRGQLAGVARSGGVHVGDQIEVVNEV